MTRSSKGDDEVLLDLGLLVIRLLRRGAPTGDRERDVARVLCIGVLVGLRETVLVGLRPGDRDRSLDRTGGLGGLCGNT